MIARVVPLRRMPSRFEMFEYQIPEGLIVQQGHVVAVPFQKHVELGVVVALAEHAEFRGTLKALLKTYGHMLSGPACAFAQWFSLCYGIYTGTIFKMLLPPLQKRLLYAVSRAHAIPPQKNGRTYVITYNSAENRTEYLQKKISHAKGQCLILVPHKEYMAALQKVFIDGLVYDSSLSNKSKREVWHVIATQDKCVVIGTRSSIFLPFFNISHVFVIDEEHDGHKSWDAAPHYRVHEPLYWLKSQCSFELHFLSRCPQVSTLFGVPSDARVMLPRRHGQRASDVTIIDTQQETRAISFAFEMKINETIERGLSVFIYCHRKGEGLTYFCKDCGLISLCSHCTIPLRVKKNRLECCHCGAMCDVPAQCAKCGGVRWGVSRPGIESVGAWLRQRFETSIVMFESGASPDVFSALQPPFICVGTDAAFPYVPFDEIGLVGVVGFDTMLAIPEYHCTEKVMSSMITLRACASESRHGARLCIQTSQPLHPIIQALCGDSLTPWYIQELSLRKTLTLPPFSQLVKISIESPHAMEKAEELLGECKKKFPRIQGTSYSLYPERSGKNERACVLFKLPLRDWDAWLCQLSPMISPCGRLDVSPISLLS